MVRLSMAMSAAAANKSSTVSDALCNHDDEQQRQNACNSPAAQQPLAHCWRAQRPPVRAPTVHGARPQLPLSPSPPLPQAPAAAAAAAATLDASTSDKHTSSSSGSVAAPLQCEANRFAPAGRAPTHDSNARGRRRLRLRRRRRRCDGANFTATQVSRTRPPAPRVRAIATWLAFARRRCANTAGKFAPLNTALVA